MYFVANDTWLSFTIKSMKFKPKSFFLENTHILNVICDVPYCLLLFKYNNRKHCFLAN